MTEWPVFRAICKTLAPLADFGYRFTRHGDEVCVDGHGTCVFVPARELIDDGDPLAVVAERLGL